MYVKPSTLVFMITNVFCYWHLNIPCGGLTEDSEAGPDRHQDIKHVEKEEGTNTGPIFPLGKKDSTSKYPKIGKTKTPKNAVFTLWTVLRSRGVKQHTLH